MHQADLACEFRKAPWQRTRCGGHFRNWKHHRAWNSTLELYQTSSAKVRAVTTACEEALSKIRLVTRALRGALWGP